MQIIRELAAEVPGLPDLDVSAVACEPQGVLRVGARSCQSGHARAAFADADVRHDAVTLMQECDHSTGARSQVFCVIGEGSCSTAYLPAASSATMSYPSSTPLARTIRSSRIRGSNSTMSRTSWVSRFSHSRPTVPAAVRVALTRLNGRRHWLAAVSFVNGPLVPAGPVGVSAHTRAQRLGRDQGCN